MKALNKFLVFCLALTTPLAYASSDGCSLWCGEYPNAYFITPSNDSRANLGLILEDQGIIHYTPKEVPFHYAEFAGPPPSNESVTPDATAATVGKDLAPWVTILGISANRLQEAVPRFAVENYGRCLMDGVPAITSLFKTLQESNLPAQDKAQLANERLRFARLCEKSLETYQPLPVSEVAKPYARYLEATAAFYAGQYDRAVSLFQALAMETKRDWVQETSLYMLGRVALNQAQIHYEGGGWTKPDEKNIDRALLGKAAAAFDSYLKSFPKGRYAESARGLFRKIHWLSSDVAALAADYQVWRTRITPGVPNQVLLDFINETESKIEPATNSIDGLWEAPLLVMQRITASWRPREAGDQSPPPIGFDAIQAHHKQFTNDRLEALWSYLGLAHNYWVAKDYAGVIQQTATDTITGKPSNVVYSRWVLRGLALIALQRWPEAEAYWQTLLKTVEHPGQKLQTQWLLALTWNEIDHLDAIYAKNSVVARQDIHDFFIDMAKPALLKYLLVREDLSLHTRSLAYFTLINKWLLHRNFNTAADILATYPSSGYALANNKLAPLTWAGQKEDYVCPPINELLAVIQIAPKAPQWLNCMGDFLRTQDWNDPSTAITESFHIEHFIVDEDASDAHYHYWHNLANYGTSLPKKSLVDPFGAKVYTSLDYYMEVIDLRGKVDPNDTAYALHRATRCFASSGNNHCGTQNIPKEQRLVWFKRLKADFKNTRWAKDQKYYW
ncbi:conserved exported hypothetical protein [Gammaproteobacteria bacterium]